MSDLVQRLRLDGINEKLPFEELRNEAADEIERLLATLVRIQHFATGNCKMGGSTRLKCISAECKAEAARADGKGEGSLRHYRFIKTVEAVEKVAKAFQLPESWLTSPDT